MNDLSRVLCAIASSVALSACLGGCGLSGTTGELVEVELSLRPSSEPEHTLGRSRSIDDDPWEIELVEARLIVGAVYLFGPRDTRSASGADSNLGAWLVPLWPSRAHAHAGDDNEIGSTAMAEHLDQVVFDALDPTPLSLGLHLAQAGRIDRGSMWLDHPRGELARLGSDGQTHGHLAWVRGRATRGNQIIEFSAGLDIENTPLRRRVDEIIPESETDLDNHTRATFGVLAGQWLREVDFSSLVPEEHDFDSGPLRIHVESPSQFHNAWQIALGRADGYTLELERR